MSVISSVLNFRNNVVVSVYRLFGVVLLVLLLGGLLFYVTSVVYFMTSNKWATPIILSPENEKVVEYNAKYTQTNKLKLKDLDIKALVLNKEMTKEEDSISSSHKILSSHKQYLTGSISRYQRELSASKSISTHLRKSLNLFKENFRKTASNMKRDLRNELVAGLITREQKIQQEAVIVNMRMKSVDYLLKLEELKKSRTDLKNNIAATKSLISNINELEKDEKNTHASASFPLLRGAYLTTSATMGSQKEIQQIAKEVHESKTRLAELKKQKELLSQTRSLVMKNKDTMDHSPLAQAQNKDIFVAFVPYENMSNFKPNSSVSKCFFYFFCSEVGSISNVLPGEITSNHPLFKYPVRGQFVKLELTDESVARTWLLQN